MSSLEWLLEAVEALTPESKTGLVLEAPFGRLRPLTPSDVYPGYVAGLNDPEVHRFLVNVHSVRQTTASVSEYVEQNLKSPEAVLFGIWFKEDAFHCGTVRLHDIGRDRRARIGICIFDRRRWGLRLGTAALKIVSAWACERARVAAIDAGIYADNAASERAFIGAGYGWFKDIADMYELNGRPVTVRVYRYTPVRRSDSGGATLP